MWNQIATHFANSSLLLGNGASIAVNNSFDYPSIFETAKQQRYLNASLIRWCIQADINPDGICIKSFRKMCISYLVATKENKYLSLLSSIGHSSITSINHYLAIPFNDTDKALINQMFYCWGEV